MMKRDSERGIALIVAIMVTLFMLSIGLVFLTSGHRSMVDSNRSKGKTVGLMVAEAGAERALWQIQQVLDAGGTVTAGNLFGGDYNNLYKNHREPVLANNYGVSYVGMGTNTKYAVKTEWMKQNELLTVYSLGVLRVSNPLTGKDSSLVEGEKVLIKVGVRTRGFDDIAIGSNGSLNFSGNAQRQITGNNAVVASNGGINMDVPNTSRYNSVVDKWIDGSQWLEGTVLRSVTDVDPLKIITSSQVTNLPGVGESKAGMYRDNDGNIKIGNKPVIIEQNATSLPELPDLDLSHFNEAEGGYKGPDYWYDSNNNDIVYKDNNNTVQRMRWSKKGDVIESPSSGTVTFWRNSPDDAMMKGYISKVYNINSQFVSQNMSNGFLNTAFYDVNNDGFTTIYLGQNSPNLRILPRNNTGGDAVGIVNGARVLIVSQGCGTNLNKDDNIPNQGNFYLPADRSNVGGGVGLGVDNDKNQNVSIEIRGQIIGVNYEVVSGQTSPAGHRHVVLLDQDNNNPIEGSLASDGTVQGSPNHNYVQSAERGSLALLAENDLILSSAGSNPELGDRSSDGDDPMDIFKGFLYSKRNLTIQIDLEFLGSIIGLNNVNMPDLTKLHPSMSAETDGGALNLYYVNPENYLPQEKVPTKGVASRNMQIVSLESGKIKI